MSQTQRCMILIFNPLSERSLFSACNGGKDSTSYCVESVAKNWKKEEKEPISKRTRFSLGVLLLLLLLIHTFSVLSLQLKKLR